MCFGRLSGLDMGEGDLPDIDGGEAQVGHTVEKVSLHHLIQQEKAS
jgi:hypothetical protein